MCEICEEDFKPTFMSASEKGLALFMVKYVHKVCPTIKGVKWIEADSLNSAIISINVVSKEWPEYTYSL
jgi:hypothetical protein